MNKSTHYSYFTKKYVLLWQSKIARLYFVRAASNRKYAKFVIRNIVQSHYRRSYLPETEFNAPTQLIRGKIKLD